MSQSWVGGWLFPGAQVMLHRGNHVDEEVLPSRITADKDQSQASAAPSASGKSRMEQTDN